MQEFMPSLYACALFAMYMLLAIAFSSYWQPALVMCAIPFGFMGAAFGHFLFDLDFTLVLLLWGRRGRGRGDQRQSRLNRLCE